MQSALRKLIFGTPFETAKAHHTRLPNILALPVFASDALSSVSYATEEILLVLVTTGLAVGSYSLGLSLPIGLAIAVLLAIVTTSYRQTIAAYPQGGGAYRVAKENLGQYAGLVAASALLFAYVMTVAVSVSAGVAAVTSALPELSRWQVPLAVGFVLFIAMANLRGAKESGLLFAAPTYLFIVTVITMLVVGGVRLALGHNLTPPQPAPGAWKDVGDNLTWLLVLRAFASGCTALTGVEAVADGVPAFRPPEAKNAQRVLFILGVILIILFVGITCLGYALRVTPFPAETDGAHGHRQTVISQIAYAVFGRSWFYFVIQAATTMSLILAANTAFLDFPRLSMFLAKDRFLPRQLGNVGDRLVFSNGIIGLTVLSIATVVAFGASTHHLIPLYAFGVFTTFTLSQAGMVVRWARLRSPGWKMGVAVSGIGAITTTLVLLIISVTKFTAGEPVEAYPLTTPLGIWLCVTAIAFVLVSMYHRWMGKWLFLLSMVALLGFALWRPGDLLSRVEIHLGAWLVMVTIPCQVWMKSRIHHHYEEVAQHLTMERLDATPDFRHTVLIVVPGVHRGIMPAVQYARSIGGAARGVYVEVDPAKTGETLSRWSHYVPDIPLVVLDSPYRALSEPLLTYLDDVERERDDDVVTVILPEFVTQKWWTKLLHNQSGLLLKWALLFKKGIVVTNIRYYLEDPAATSHFAHPLASHLDEETAPPHEETEPPRATPS